MSTTWGEPSPPLAGATSRAMPCPLPATSDLPFSLEALQAFNVEAKRVLDAHGLVPLEGTRATLLPGLPRPRHDAPANWAGSRAARGSAFFRAAKEQRAIEGPTGDRLRQLRVASSLTLRAVSTATGLSRGGLQSIETGQRMPSASVRGRIEATILALVRARRPRWCAQCGAVLPLAAWATTKYCSGRCRDRAKWVAKRAQAAQGHADAA